MGQFQKPSVTISEDVRVVTLSCSPHFFCPGLTQNPVTHPVCRVLNTLFFSAGEKVHLYVTYHPLGPVFSNSLGCNSLCMYLTKEPFSTYTSRASLCLVSRLLYTGRAVESHKLKVLGLKN